MRASVVGILVFTSLSGCIIAREDLHAPAIDASTDTHMDARVLDAAIDTRTVGPDAVVPDAVVPTGTCTGHPAGFVCRASRGACDLEEQCNGTSADCPPDGLRMGACREAASACELAASCGAGVDCPANLPAPSGTPCPIGVCDGAGTCVPCANGTPCTPSPCRMGTISCSSGRAECVDMEAAPNGTACSTGAAGGACSGPDACQGGVCVATFMVGMTCRPPVGPCDAPEACGAHPDCPADRKADPGTLCRVAANACDIPDQCDGMSNDCPDLTQGAGFVCRAATGACDVQEVCPGGGVPCPADRFVPAMTECRRDMGRCDRPEFCTGASGMCPADAFPEGDTCNGGNDRCCAGMCRRGLAPC